MLVVGNIFGVLGLITMGFSYYQKKKKDFLFEQIFANLFYALQYLFLKAFSGMSTTFISIARSVIFYLYEKDNKKVPIIYLILFITSFILCGIYSYNGLISLIPILIAIIYTLGTWQKNLKITYGIGIFVSILWIIYNFRVSAYFGFIGAIYELISSSIGLYKLIKNK